MLSSKKLPPQSVPQSIRSSILDTYILEFWICRKISLNENPSVGVVLCASKDDAVVEYALSRSMSPTLVSDYKLCLPDKEALQAKLREVTDIALEQADK